MDSVAVILAGGLGRRLGLTTPKQLATVAGRPVLARAIETFDSAPGIGEILVVMATGHAAEAERVAAPYGKVSGVIEGGATRTESTLRALAALGDRAGDTVALFHDAARPFVSGRIVADCLAALEHDQVVAVAVPCSDTVVVVDGDRVSEMPSRDRLRRFQTPQGFRLATLRRAYELALADPLFADRPPTDDCGVVHRYLPDLPIRIVEGSEDNIKVTHPIDLLVAEQIAADRR